LDSGKDWGVSSMTLQKLTICFMACLVCLIAMGTTSAGVIIDWIEVGDPGNPENTVIKKDDFSSGYGSVAYEFRIGKYETTNDQYVEFLNAVAKTDTYTLYDNGMRVAISGGITRSGTSGNYSYTIKPNMGNKPVVYVTWYDAARFANWLQNGQPTGLQDASTTEDGAYTFSGAETVSDRNPNAQYFLPTEHEWEKAAFYEPGADTPLGDGWWTKPSHSDIAPLSALADEFGNVTNPGPHVVAFQRAANWNGSTIGNVVTVGSAGNESFFGVRDMPGNVFEWVVADPTKPDPNGWGPYTVRGGAFNNMGHVDIYERNLVHHDNHNHAGGNVGFRLAAAMPPLILNAADFNGDGFVDGADLEIWQTAFEIGGSADADADGDGDSDGHDFLIWQHNFSPAPEEATFTAVPEPSALSLAVCLPTFCFCKRRRMA
jgi:formylglycine-generating enzyme required for sulfatase activity